MKFISFVCLLLCASLAIVRGDDVTHKYEEGDEVVLFVNKVGPYHNPQETYEFYDKVPWCPPETKIQSRLEGLGEALQGYELIRSNLELHFKDNGVNNKVFCSQTLTEETAETLIYAIKNRYWYEFFLDDLPVWGFVGDVSEAGKVYMWTHLALVVSYNQDRIIEVKLTTEKAKEVVAKTKMDLTYTVQWVPTTTEFEHRFDKYLDDKFFEHQIHWFSIFNSFMMVFFLVGLVSMILMRTLKQDYATYTKADEEEDSSSGLDVVDESGWKQVHGDVFRAPPYLHFFSALIGTGTQLVVLGFCVIFLSVGFYHERGSILTAMVVCYAFTSFIAGYVGGSFYLKNGGKSWIKTMLLSALLLPGIIAAVAFLLNFIAIYYGSLSAIPFTTMLVVILIWALISLPLTLCGTVVGRNWAGVPDYPCRISPMPRPIPEKKWYQEPLVHIILGGILPFGSVFIEMYFVFTAFWQYKYYYVFGFLFLVFVILIVVTVCVTIVSTYFLLNSEDYRWHWVSFFAAASTAAYVYIYAVYYFYAKTHMSGFFQTAYYFGYTASCCTALGLLCGAIGFTGADTFVRRIYRNIKID